MICYVILHYKNLNDTIKCLDSLKKTASQNSKFIVVDNGSCDDSEKKLKELYGSSSQFHILILPQNVGFSKGN